MRRINIFDDGTISGIKPTGSLRVELRENKIKEIILRLFPWNSLMPHRILVCFVLNLHKENEANKL